MFSRARRGSTRSRPPRAAGWRSCSRSSTSRRACGSCRTRRSRSCSRTRATAPGAVADFFVVGGAPWLIKPLYGLLSDFFPIFGRRRVSYLFLSSSLAAAGGFLAAALGTSEYGTLLVLFTAMGLGLAFTDVLADAVMVENGRQHGLTGAFQSVQWASIYISSMLVGLIGGWLAQRRNLVVAFLVAACFPADHADHDRGVRAREAGPPGSGRAPRAPRRGPRPRCARGSSGWSPASSSSSRSVPRSGPDSSTTRPIGWASASSSSAS